LSSDSNASQSVHITSLRGNVEELGVISVSDCRLSLYYSLWAAWFQ